MKYKTKESRGKKSCPGFDDLEVQSSTRFPRDLIFRQNTLPIFLPIFLLLTNPNECEANHAYKTTSCIGKLYMHTTTSTIIL